MTAKLYIRRGGGASVDTEYTELNPSLRKGAPFFDHDQPLIQLGMRFESGEASQGYCKIMDPLAEVPTATFRFPPHALVTLTEDAPGPEIWLSRGRVAPLESGRGDVRVANEIEHDITVNDGNMDLRGLPFTEQWVRPAETDVARINALEDFILNGAASTMADGVRVTTDITVVAPAGGHLCPNSDTVTMPAKTYPTGTQPIDVLADCAETSGKVFGVVIHHNGGSHLCLLYIVRDDHSTFATNVKVSQDLADFDPDDPTAPVFEPVYDMGKASVWDHDKVMTALVSRWNGTNDDPDAVFVDRPGLIADYEYWGETFDDAESKTEAQAELRANAILDGMSPSDLTNRVSIVMSPSQTDLICAGMSIEIKGAPLATGPVPSAFQTRRIAQLQWEPHEDGRWWAHMQLGRGLARRGPRSGGGQPKSTTPKPPTPGTGAEFVASNSAGADSPDMSVGISPGEANLLLLDFITTDATVAASAEYQDVNDPPTFVDAGPQALTELEFVATADHDMTLLALDDPDLPTGASSRVLHEHPDGRHAAAVLLYRGATIAGLGDLQSGSGTSLTPSITVSTSVGDLVVAGIGYHRYDTGGGGVSIADDPDQTRRELAWKAGTHIAAIVVSEKVATGASTTLSWTLTASRQYSAVAVVIPDGGSGDTTEPVGDTGSGSPGSGGTYSPINHIHPHGNLSEDEQHHHDASDIEYDQVASELGVDNVQEAIDGLAGLVEDIDIDVTSPGDFLVGTLSNPPTEAEVEAVIGSPGAVAKGTVFGLQDSGTEKRYLAITDGVQWHTIPLVTPLEVSGVAALTSAPAGGWAGTTNAAFYFDGVTYFSYVRGDNGNVEARTYTHSTNTVSAATVLHAALNDDLHSAPSGAMLSDNRIIFFYSDHAGAAMFQWISTNPEDISAGTETNIDSQLGGTGYTYPMVADLTSGLHLFVRHSGGAAAGQDWGYSVSTDDGTTWSLLEDFYTVPTKTGYPLVVKTGPDRVDVIAIDGSTLESNDDIQHFYFDAGQWFAADGTDLTLPIGTEPEIVVWNGGAGDDGFGRFDVQLGTDGHPRILFATINGTTETYRHGRWDGSAWVLTSLVVVTAPDADGAQFDSLDPNILYLVDGSHEIRRLTTIDEVTWASETLTTGTTSIYPISPVDHAPDLPVIWLAGSFTSSAVYDLGITGFGASSATAVSDSLQRIVVLDDTDLGELVIRRTSGGDWEFSLDGSLWESVGGGGASALDDLTDVVITSPAEGDMLRFDGVEWVNTPGRWEPVTTNPGGGPELVWDGDEILMTWVDT